jgi:CheY-like chemotaxis protein
MDRLALANLLRSALLHLGSPAQLERHQVATLLLPDESRPRGDRVRRTLLDLIEELRPLTPESWLDAGWRRYRHLVARYVDGQTRDQVAATQGVSTRQASRDHEQAVDELVDLLVARSSVRPGLTEQAEPAASRDAGADLLREAASVAAHDAEATDLAEALDAVVATFAPSWSAKGIVLRTLVPDTLPPVAISRTLLRQAVVNALSHVVHVADPEEIVIAGSDTGLGPAVRITGYGARDVSSPASDPSLEAGRRLLEMQGGWVETEAVTGGYSAVLRLPSVQLRKLLVVDDNPDVVMLFQRYLRGAQYRVVQATSGPEAVRIGRELRPDVIALDVMLPTQDGWDILTQLRTFAETRETPVVVCSVLPEREIALSLGAADFLAKPITRAALLESLDRCLGDPTPRPARP